MLVSWFLRRSIRSAIASGRLQEASELLAVLPLKSPATIELRGLLADAFLRQARQYLDKKQFEDSWRSLISSETLRREESAAKLRLDLVAATLKECRAALASGKPERAVEKIAILADRGAETEVSQTLLKAARDWILASEQADAGHFPLAKETLLRAASTLEEPERNTLVQFLDSVVKRSERRQIAIEKLVKAAESRSRREALQWADELIAIAPNDREARELRSRAWHAAFPDNEPVLKPRKKRDVLRSSFREDQITFSQISLDEATSEKITYTPTPHEPPEVPRGKSQIPTERLVELKPALEETPQAAATVIDRPTQETSPPKRFMLWIDGVGGYRVCLAPRVTFGQAMGSAPVDVPLFADLARVHAEIVRDEEGYILESAREVQVNAQTMTRTVLKKGDRITLGSTCQMIFQQPLPLSATARLELVSGHRPPTASDGVILMADSLILGSSSAVHLKLGPDAPETVVLFRTKTGISLRAPGTFRVDDLPHTNRADLTLPCVVVGEGFSFALEPTGTTILRHS